MPLALRVDVDEHTLDEAGSRIENALDRVGGSAASEFISGFKGGLSSGMSGALSEIRSSFSEVEGGAAAMGSRVSAGAALAGVAVAGIGTAAVVVGKQLYDLGSQWDSISDSIAAKTGRVGAELDKITDSVKRVGAESSASLSSIGDIAGTLAGALDIAGKPLDDLTLRIADLQEMTGDKLNIRELAKVFHGFGIDANDMSGSLDRLYDTFTNTQIPVSELVGTLQQVGPIARTLGLDIGQTAGLLATFDEAGVSAENAMSGLRIAIGNLSSATKSKGPLADFLKDEQGKDLDTKLGDLITRIHDTGSIDLAKSAFGRSFSTIFDAIANGKLTVDDLNKSADNTGHTIEKSRDATADWAEELGKLTNKIKIEFAPVANQVFGGINSLLEKGANLFSSLGFSIDQGFVTGPGAGSGGLLGGDLLGLGRGATPGSPPDIGGSFGHPPPQGALGSPGSSSSSGGIGSAPDNPLVPGYRTPLRPGEKWSPGPGQPELQWEAGKGWVPVPPSKTSSSIGQAEVPYGPGYGAPPRPGETTAIYNAEQGIIEAQHNIAQSRAQLARVEADSKSTTDQLVKARNDVTKAEAEGVKAQLRLQDAYISAEKKADTAGAALDSFGSKLDSDLGLSKGLPGLAENLFRFLGNLAAAPLLGPLSAMANAQGGIGQTGSGLIGMAASSGAFGPRFQAGGSTAGGAGVSAGTPTIPSTPSLGGINSAADVVAGGSRVAALYALADSLEGTPYSTPLRNDCSGMMNQLVNAAVGLPQPSAGQRFSTPTEGAFLQQHGFTMTGSSTQAPPGSFRIGWNPAPGMSGHTAGTLPNGQNVEQGGNTSGFTVGPGAAGYNDPFFTQHAYLPMGGYAPMPDITNPALYTPQGYDGGGAVGYNPNSPTGGSNFNPNIKIDTSRIHLGRSADFLLSGKAGPNSQLSPSLLPKDYYNWLLLNSGGFRKGFTNGGGVDTVPAMLAPGEHVLTTDDVNAMGGQSGVYNFRNALHYTEGGGVGSYTPGTNPLDVFTGNAPKSKAPPPASLGGAPPTGAGAAPRPGSPPSFAGQRAEATTIGGNEQPAPPGGGESGGGLFGAAVSAGAMAADAFAPGSGAAVQIAGQEISRAVKFGAQAAGIGVGGLMQTFLPTGASDLANNNWITRIAGGFAGVQPQIPNTAGKPSTPVPPAEPPLAPPLSSGQGSGPPPGPAPIVVNYTHNGAKEDPAIRDLSDHLTQTNQNIAQMGHR